jgi:hypothetical protein
VRQIFQKKNRNIGSLHETETLVLFAIEKRNSNNHKQNGLPKYIFKLCRQKWPDENDVERLLD